MLEKPKFLQGVAPFTGQGLDQPQSFQSPVQYQVPFDRRSQLIYFRGGNSSDELIYLLMLRNGQPMRYFPIGARSAIHISLSVVEDLNPDTRLELQIAAPTQCTGTVVYDLGIMEF